jgi:hypothetical protein
MNDYLVTGTRQQYWEELFVKHIMEVGQGGQPFLAAGGKLFRFINTCVMTLKMSVMEFV